MAPKQGLPVYWIVSKAGHSRTELRWCNWLTKWPTYLSTDQVTKKIFHSLIQSWEANSPSSGQKNSVLFTEYKDSFFYSQHFIGPCSKVLVSIPF